MCELYEAEQRKIGFGEWALHNESGDITLIKEGDNLSAVNSNFTKLSPEAQDILNKETGKKVEFYADVDAPLGDKPMWVPDLVLCSKCNKPYSSFAHICKDIVQGEG
jgi:hypothetical protein